MSNVVLSSKNPIVECPFEYNTIGYTIFNEEVKRIYNRVCAIPDNILTESLKKWLAEYICEELNADLAEKRTIAYCLKYEATTSVFRQKIQWNTSEQSPWFLFVPLSQPDVIALDARDGNGQHRVFSMNFPLVFFQLRETSVMNEVTIYYMTEFSE